MGKRLKVMEGRKEGKKEERKGKEKKEEKRKEKERKGVPFMAQRLTNPTRIHEDEDLIPGLTQWVKDLALP